MNLRVEDLIASRQSQIEIISNLYYPTLHYIPSFFFFTRIINMLSAAMYACFETGHPSHAAAMLMNSEWDADGGGEQLTIALSICTPYTIVATANP